jgi:tetratricopeptide (TPR) repeat protein
MTRVAFFLFLASLVVAGCSRKDDAGASRDVRKTCAAVKAATRGIYRVESAVAGDAKRPTFVSLDVAGMTAKDLKAKLLEMGDPRDAHLWMPGEQSWVVVKHAADEKVSLAKALDALADDDVCTISLPEVFASYVGTLADVLPAFASELKGEVVPEWFVTKDVRDVPWLDAAGVDADIAKGVRAEIRSMQNVRREVLKGNMAARAAKDKKGEEAACEIWAKAALRNPNDTLLLERIETLERNAKGFLEVGRPLQAMKCFETIILIQPKHASAVHNFGLCLQKLGKRDLADQVLKRAETLRQAAEADAAK